MLRFGNPCSLESVAVQGSCKELCRTLNFFHYLSLYAFVRLCLAHASTSF